MYKKIAMSFILIMSVHNIYSSPNGIPNVSLDVIKPYLPSNPIIVEAGAHEGEDTILLAHFWPNCTIYAFEPLPIVYRQLQKKVQNLGNIKTYQMALNDKEGLDKFYVCIGNDGASSLQAPRAELDGFLSFERNPIYVNCINLDQWANQHNIDHIDFLWFDMEGNELKVLQSSPNILKTVKAIHLEINFHRFREGTPLYDEIKDWLIQNGFNEVSKIVINDSKGPFQGNALFVR